MENAADQAHRVFYAIVEIAVLDDEHRVRERRRGTECEGGNGRGRKSARTCEDFCMLSKNFELNRGARPR